jgi:hypothetical protein
MNGGMDSGGDAFSVGRWRVRRSLPRPNPAGILPQYVLLGRGGLPCTPPPGGPVPVPVPSSGATQVVKIVDGVHGQDISGLSITCSNTGVTVNAGCSYATFYRASMFTAQTYSTPGGNGTQCMSPHQVHVYSSGSTTTTTPQLTIPVTQLD